ncbi:MAG: hypothetical protein IKU43_00560, partial [Clostridia bacterium]|nr:hypothetical protein [Clostridia bacterium]
MEPIIQIFCGAFFQKSDSPKASRKKHKSKYNSKRKANTMNYEKIPEGTRFLIIGLGLMGG